MGIGNRLPQGLMLRVTRVLATRGAVVVVAMMEVDVCVE